MSNSPDYGIACLYLSYSNNYGYSYHGARLMYTGDESTVHVIDDSTEEL